MKIKKKTSAISNDSILSFKMLVLAFCILLMYSNGRAQVGRVGINTATPLAGLHVADSSVLFSGTSVLPSNPGQVPVSGAGHRFMWYPQKGALRAGGLHPSKSTNWDRDSIGQYSIGIGRDNKAKGLNSLTLGSSGEALGSGSIVIGNGIAAGQQATAIGFANAYGHQSTAFHLCSALGPYSIAGGILSYSYGESSIAFGHSNLAYGNRSIAMGSKMITNAFGSFAVGTSNDTLVASRTSWVDTDHLFVVGNGPDDFTKRNAMVVLKNGDMGLGTNSPTFRLHLRGTQPSNGGFVDGIMIQNTNESPGEAAISFRNSAMAPSKQWMVGLDQSPTLTFNYGNNMINSNSKIVVDTTGRMGLNTLNPQAPVHVVQNGPSGGPFNPSAIAIYESNTPSFIQLSNLNNHETGILSGNLLNAIRSCIVFSADSSIDLRAGGNSTDVKISTEGNVGIGIYTPTSKLQVHGTSKLGINGTPITEIIKATVNTDVPPIPANSTLTVFFSVTNAGTDSAVSVSPDLALPLGVAIGSARVSAAENIQVRFVNTTAVQTDPGPMDFHFTVIR